MCTCICCSQTLGNKYFVIGSNWLLLYRVNIVAIPVIMNQTIGPFLCILDAFEITPVENYEAISYRTDFWGLLMLIFCLFGILNSRRRRSIRNYHNIGTMLFQDGVANYLIYYCSIMNWHSTSVIAIPATPHTTTTIIIIVNRWKIKHHQASTGGTVHSL